jgi:hypothetical protein
MVTSDGDLVAIDEWPDEEQCKKFLQSAPKMAGFLAGDGISSSETISVYNSIGGSSMTQRPFSQKRCADRYPKNSSSSAAHRVW